MIYGCCVSDQHRFIIESSIVDIINRKIDLWEDENYTCVSLLQEANLEEVCFSVPPRARTRSKQCCGISVSQAEGAAQVTTMDHRVQQPVAGL